VTSTTPAKETNAPRLLLNRGETLEALRVGETTLFWLARTEKLKPIRIGGRVLFSRAEVERLARTGCSLTAAEKRTAAKHERKASEAA
jgi:Helix-turn-helix domain